MPSFKNILVPFDFSNASGEALKTAIQLGLRYDASLCVLTVIERTPDDEILRLLVLPKDVEAKLKHKIHLEIHEILSPENRKKIRFEAHVRKGKAALEILRLSEEEKTDLIVMGTHGRTGLKHLLLGSTAEKVVRRSGAPVFIHRGTGGVFPRKILLPIDFSDYSLGALQKGAEWAADLKAELILLHVIDLRDLYTFDLLSLPADRKAIEAALKTEAEQKMERFCRDLHLPHRKEIRLGDPSIEIQEAIKSHSIDCVILATHGRSGLKHLLLGSIAEKVIRYSPCSVLVIRPSQFFRSTTQLFEGEKSFEDYMKGLRD